MMGDLPISSFAVTLFALVNPIGGAVVFMTMVQDCAKSMKQRYALKVMLFIFIAQSIVALIGTKLLSAFGISIPAFTIAGGALLASIGYTMMSGEMHSSSHNQQHSAANTINDPTVIPITIPLCVGPGVMVTIIAFMAHHGGWSANLYWHVECIIASISLLTGLIFISTTYIPKLSLKAIYVVNRIMGLIICSMGAQLIINAIKAL